MTVLQALNSYYDRMAARGEVAPTGYSREKISYAILLTPDGAVAIFAIPRGRSPHRS